MRNVGIARSAQRALAVALAGAACLAIALFMRSAHAAEPVVSSLSFAGTTGCDDQAALEREIARRFETVTWTAQLNAEVTIDVQLSGDSGPLNSVVIFRRAGAKIIRRTISSGNCSEVLEGTALIIAVLLSQREKELGAHTQSADKAVPLQKEASTSQPSLQTEESPRWQLGGGAAGVLVANLSPGVLPGIEAFGDLGLLRQGWAPTLRIGVRYLQRSGFSYQDARAAFELWSGTATACPVAWLFDPRWTLRPCVALAYGSLKASGSNLASPHTERHPWIGISGGIRVQLRLARLLSAELEATSEAALVRSRFQFDEVTFHEAAPMNARMALGLFVHVP